ncbi:MAG: sugar transferase [Deltaproteobacteria bacterium]|nr:sugar transferase [Deltaproteobacteria bacterium]
MTVVWGFGYQGLDHGRTDGFLSSRPWLHALILVLLDVGALLLALWISFAAWNGRGSEGLLQARSWGCLPPDCWILPLLVLLPSWILSNHLQGLYEPARLGSSTRIASSVFRSAFYVLLLALVLEFLEPGPSEGRRLVLLFPVLGFLFQAPMRLAFFRVQLAHPPPLAVRRLAIYGAGDEAVALRDRIGRHAGRACEVAGYLVPSGDEIVRAPPDEVLGPVDDLPGLVGQHGLDMLIVATRSARRPEVFRLLRQCEALGLRVLELPYASGFSAPRLSFVAVAGLQLIDLQSLAYPTFARSLKRAFDLVVVLVGGIVLSPLLLAVALAIRLTSPGPILYVSPRVGRGGHPFLCYKFRSMVIGAHALRTALQDRNEADGRLFKMRQDPRITSVGRIIRRCSVDELAQLWNVLRGDMNLVGPRPLPVEDLEDIERDCEAAYWFELRSKVKPGMTGLWQVSGRSDLPFAEMVALDIQYVQTWSVWLDLLILFKTLPAVVRGEGAA